MSTDFEAHPLADLFPLIEGADFDDLCEDIREHGQREPIVLFDGRILDGRNRYRACREIGIEPEFRQFDRDREGDPEAFVFSVNAKRRHLDQKGKQTLARRLIQDHDDWSNRQVARIVGVDHKTVASIREVMIKEVAELGKRFEVFTDAQRLEFVTAHRGLINRALDAFYAAEDKSKFPTLNSAAGART